MGKIYLVRPTACRIIPILFVLLVGCSLLPNDLKTAETALQTNPDSALSILKKMNKDRDKEIKKLLDLKSNLNFYVLVFAVIL